MAGEVSKEGDRIVESLSIGSFIMGVFVVVMWGLLPLGIFSHTLDLQHFLWLKFLVAIIAMLITFKFYANFVKGLRTSIIAIGFSITWILIAGEEYFVLTDIVLKILGLE
ncbi:MAG: hypothetical protein GWP10_15485 [Nitrospiraceae bacterium]|nr:hypothetical protein [Nitrospiraceae bacterium]